MAHKTKRCSIDRPGVTRLLGALLIFLGLTTTEAFTQPAAIKLAVVASLTGSGDFYGVPALDAARMAVEEANSEPNASPVQLMVTDDQSSPQRAAELARNIAGSDAVAVIGPDLTVAAVASGPIYARAGLVSIVPTAHGEAVTSPATTFQAIFNTNELGSALANYLFHVLQGRRAVLLFREDAFGLPVAFGFRRAAGRLGIQASYHGFSTDAERDEAARLAATEPGHPAVALGMLVSDAVPLLTALRRGGVQGPILGPDSIAGDNVADLFAKEPEERDTPGFFTNNLFAASPIMFDSADDKALRFARRFHDRFGREPTWTAVQGYDATLLAIAAARHAVETVGAAADLKLRRAAVRDYLVSLDSPEHAVPGISGALWFTQGRGREQTIRIGRFRDKLFESAPTQLVPVARPDPSEIAAGGLIETDPGRYVRRQQVVSTGIYVNEIPRVDISQSSFGADFYLWLRYARNADPSAADPTDITFPGMIGASFDRTHPAEAGEMPDGTLYRLWRVRGTFRNDFDLHRFPFDAQTLSVTFFNARAASDRIVYALDRRSGTGGSLRPPATPGGALAAVAGAPGPGVKSPIASPEAFRNLTQWAPLGVGERRENLVTASALGDPRRVGAENFRELSGFMVAVDIQRRAIATLAKSLMPLLLMTLIMYASLYFPHGLVKEKVTVAITGALAGAVLLTAINSQLGGVGYTVAVEYAFYVFFALSTLCIVSVLAAERMRVAGQTSVAVKTEHLTRLLFLLAVLGIAVGATMLWLSTGEGL